MKKKEEEKRGQFFKVRMNKNELEALKKLKSQSIERSVSNYARKVLLQKPVTIRYRNASADDFLKDMKDLNKELNAIGNNFNQAVHRLHLLEKIPEFREWIREHERLYQRIDSKIQDIHKKVVQLYEQWLQK